ARDDPAFCSGHIDAILDPRGDAFLEHLPQVWAVAVAATAQRLMPDGYLARILHVAGSAGERMSRLPMRMPIPSTRLATNRTETLYFVTATAPPPPAWTTTRSTSCWSASAVKTRQRFVSCTRHSAARCTRMCSTC